MLLFPSDFLYLEGCPSGYVELIQKCWHQDPAQRPPIDQIVEAIMLVKQGSYVC